MHGWPAGNLAGNLLAWTEQAFILAGTGWLLLMIFRVRHAASKLIYCHALLAACLLLPWIQPWGHSTTAEEVASGATQLRLILWLLAAGGAAKLGWLLAGLWRIRKCRISSMPMYPIPESVRAASAVTHADALFCVSEEIPGPVMLGWLTPVVLMPQAFLSMEEDAQCGVACHELLHVRRHDWLVTVLEELAGALLWFNPAIWPVLAQARLAREQLVDAEVVRLTAAREPYIDALLAIARGGSGLDLAPAPLFLRRRHLTQRVHSLLKDTAASRPRLISSYASMALILGAAGWAGAMSFPLIGRVAPVNLHQVDVHQVGVHPVDAAPVAIAPAAAPAAAVPSPAAAAPEADAYGIDTSPEMTPAAYIPSAPVPGDPRELAAVGVRPLSSPADLEAARAWMSRAEANARLAAATRTPPYRFDVSFTAFGLLQADGLHQTGGPNQSGGGTLSEIWKPGVRRWTADLDGFSVTRWTTDGNTVEDRYSRAIPWSVEALRDAIHWPARMPPAGRPVRSVDGKWEGRPVSCLLFSAWTGVALLTPGRLWEESEYCIDTASGLLQIESIVPGSYTVYGYDAGLRYHGRAMPDRITIYTGGAMETDAKFNITDMTAEDENLLTAAGGAGPVVVLELPARVPIKTSNPFPATVIQPVMVEAEIDGSGNVVEAELCAAADPALAQRALELVRQTRFKHRPWTQYQLFVNVKFMPSGK